MNILVTGGSGFIGRNIQEALSGTYGILAPSHRECDLTDEHSVRQYLRSHQVDVVIHGAVKPGHRNAADPTGQLFANTRMFFNLLRNKDRFSKMIFLGSGAVYDVRYPMPKVSEEYFDTHVPADEHGFSKYLIAKHSEQLEDVVKLRLFGIFGKYEDYAIRFISNAICKALLDLPITIRQNRRFDYLFIDDLMPVLEHFIENRGSQVAYNVTPDSVVELLGVAELVRERSGKDVPIILGTEGLGPEYSGDNSRLRREVPGLSFTPLRQAIDQLYDWYEDNLASIDRAKLLVDK